MTSSSSRASPVDHPTSTGRSPGMQPPRDIASNGIDPLSGSRDPWAGKQLGGASDSRNEPSAPDAWANCKLAFARGGNTAEVSRFAEEYSLDQNARRMLLEAPADAQQTVMQDLGVRRAA
eukprot:CAMPEP_0169289192 /NCGR_PEP_ID=MMETSP1016-20121227/60994_1 /TAXON_ID=342587 /ORGANISM="Karlodinium micrum, Strain CCMP2283" /LENGTH=119 /DNA_ID=CAMNT_0009379537 /DNA_START=1 /DNA_END=357 /DNA_ORIENTATION=+